MAWMHDRVDVNAAKEHGITVTGYAGWRIPEAVGELAFALILAVAGRFRIWIRDTKKKWMDTVYRF